jgi:thiosulfate/3-mercaptopyruvate sulfurtransferase
MNLVTRLRAIGLLLIIALPLPALAAPQGWTAMLEPAQLANILMASPNVRVIQVTGDYSAGHIPGAINVPYSQFRGPNANPGAVPSLEELTAVVRNIGVNAQTPVVVVHGGTSSADFGAAARVYWTLKSLGVKDLALLNGGFAGWASANLPVSNNMVMVAASDFSPQWSDQWRVSTADIEESIADNSVRLIDARTADFFEGIQASSGRPGTIKGAANITFSDFFEGSRVKPQTQLSQILASHAQPAVPLTVSFCNTGHLAAINWFIMSELQDVPNTRLYAESMTEWSMANRPMDNEPNRIKHYWRMTTDWFSSLRGA